LGVSEGEEEWVGRKESWVDIGVDGYVRVCGADCIKRVREGREDSSSRTHR